MTCLKRLKLKEEIGRHSEASMKEFGQKLTKEYL
jgi:hypothetical protein